MNLVFLVYDSRSGSTLLSREISAHFSDVFVTPEIRFDPFLLRGETWVGHAGADGVAMLLRQYRYTEKTGLSEAEIHAALAVRNPLTIQGVMEDICLQIARRDGLPRPATIIVKSGAHLWVWRRIRRILPDARFLFVVRDPRAVVFSKLNTERPYHAGQSMAWAGCAAAAIQWRWYARNAARIAATQGSLLEVRYEELLADPTAVMGRIGAFIGSASAGRRAAYYRVPQAEQAIHRLVLTEGLAIDRADAWREGLGAQAREVIEQLCGREMRARGYLPVPAESTVARLAVTAQELLRSGWRIGREFGARALARAVGDGRD